MQRLKYYYGVIECDSVEIASHLYDELDGMTADNMTPVALELRFVPDDLKFPHKPTSVCTELPPGYELADGPVGATGHSKVECSWDQDDPKRTKFMTKRHSEKELAEMDLRDYLASSSEEDLDESNLEEYRRKLLGDAADAASDDEGAAADEDGEEDEEEAEDADREFSFRADVNDLAEKVQTKAKALQTAGALGKAGLGGEQKKNSWQSYLERKKEKKKLRKKELKDQRAAKAEAAEAPEPRKKWPSSVVRMDTPAADDDTDQADDGTALLDSGDEERHFDLKKKKARGQKVTKMSESVGAAFELDTADDRISKVFADADFAIDPTNPEYRDSVAMRKLLSEKRGKKRARAVEKTERQAKVGKSKPVAPAVDDGFKLFA